MPQRGTAKAILALICERRLSVKKLKVTQVKSYIGRPAKQRSIIKGMGLGKINRTVLLNDTPEIRGMAQKVLHLIVIEEVEGSELCI